MKPFIRNGLLITLGATIAGAAISLAATHALPGRRGVSGPLGRNRRAGPVD
jgi:hypothetical protein